MLSSVRHILHAIATTVIPEAAWLDLDGWVELDAVIATALAARDPRVQRQCVTFLRAVQWLPLVRHGRPFTALPAHHRRAFLARLERSPLLRIRRGIWGVRTLVFMGYYTRAEVAEAIGYQPSAAGWEACGGTDATVPLAPVVWVEP